MAVLAQEEALASTRRLLDQEPCSQAAGTVHLHLGCHSRLREFVDSTAGATDLLPPRLICFNLGAPTTTVFNRLLFHVKLNTGPAPCFGHACRLASWRTEGGHHQNRNDAGCAQCRRRYLGYGGTHQRCGVCRT